MKHNDSFFTFMKIEKNKTYHKNQNIYTHIIRNI